MPEPTRAAQPEQPTQPAPEPQPAPTTPPERGVPLPKAPPPEPPHERALREVHEAQKRHTRKEVITVEVPKEVPDLVLLSSLTLEVLHPGGGQYPFTPAKRQLPSGVWLIVSDYIPDRELHLMRGSLLVEVIRIAEPDEPQPQPVPDPVPGGSQ